MEHNYEEKEIISDVKENFEIDDETIEKVLNDFKKLGIKEDEFLRDLTSFVVWKKVSLAINKAARGFLNIACEEEFSYEESEQEAIEYYANENMIFSEKHSNLLKDGEQYLDDKFNYFSGLYDDEVNYIKNRH